MRHPRAQDLTDAEDVAPLTVRTTSLRAIAGTGASVPTSNRRMSSGRVTRRERVVRRGRPSPEFAARRWRTSARRRAVTPMRRVSTLMALAAWQHVARDEHSANGSLRPLPASRRRTRREALTVRVMERSFRGRCRHLADHERRRPAQSTSRLPRSSGWRGEPPTRSTQNRTRCLYHVVQIALERVTVVSHAEVSGSQTQVRATREPQWHARVRNLEALDDARVSGLRHRRGDDGRASRYRNVTATPCVRARCPEATPRVGSRPMSVSARLSRQLL